MKKSEARAFIKSLVNLRTSASDELAATGPNVYPTWRADTQYNQNDRILYNNVLYKVLSNHKSQEDWVPNAVASLYAKVLIPDTNQVYAWEQPESTNP